MILRRNRPQLDSNVGHSYQLQFNARHWVSLSTLTCHREHSAWKQAERVGNNACHGQISNISLIICKGSMLGDRAVSNEATAEQNREESK